MRSLTQPTSCSMMSIAMKFRIQVQIAALSMVAISSSMGMAESRPPDIATPANVRFRTRRALDLARPQDDAGASRQRMARQIESPRRGIGHLDRSVHVY